MNAGRDWENRYAGTPCLFGNTPSPLLVRHSRLLQPGMQALAVGDGEGRNGLWLARRGLQVLALDLSPTALHRARQQADEEGLAFETCCIDALAWSWPRQAFDVITLIFVHLPPPQRMQLHRLIQTALRPGGLLFIEAYHTDQIHRASAGPTDPALLYTEDALCRDFAALETLHLEKTVTDVVVGNQARGCGVVVHFVARC